MRQTARSNFHTALRSYRYLFTLLLCLVFLTIMPFPKSKGLLDVFETALVSQALASARVQIWPRFSFNFSDASMCQAAESRRGIIAMIFSAPDHFENRAMVRSTWVGYLKDADINGAYFFVIGSTSDHNSQRKIDEENSITRDIIQYDVPDTYSNLPYKTVATVEFLAKLCHNSSFDFVLKTDDDVYVNVPNLISAADQLRLCGRFESRSFFCNDFRAKDPVKRAGKWALSKDDYAADHFPKFCAGTGYMFTWDLVKALLDATAVTPFFIWEDVYLSGMCAGKLDDVRYFQAEEGTFTHTVQNFKAMGDIHETIQRPTWKAPAQSRC